MDRQQRAKMEEVARDYWIRALYHKVPHPRFIVQTLLTGMVIAWELGKENEEQIDYIMRKTESTVMELTPRELEYYSRTKEAEWKYNI